MQREQRLLTFLLGTVVAMGASMAQVFVCPGDQVQFEVTQPNYGDKTWEYSPDGLDWTYIVVEESAPFSFAPELSGYYRVRLHDAACDVFYTSEVKQVVVPTITLGHVFSEQFISTAIDPVFWLAGRDGLTDVVYTINGVEVPSTTQNQVLTNPGVDFTVWATAVDPLGCTLYSDTLVFTVFDPTISAAGVVQPEAVVDLTGVLVSSSIDVTGLMPDGSFTLDYSLDFLVDEIIAYRDLGGADDQFVAIRLATTSSETLVLDEVSTAIAMVLMLPDVAYLAPTHYQEIADWLALDQDFIALKDMLVSDLEQLGHLDLEDEGKWTIANALAASILSDLLPQLSPRDAVASPSVENVNGNDQLTYSHEGINLCYAAGVYRGGSMVSEPILFAGDGTPALVGNTVNLVYQLFNFNTSPPFRSSNTILMSDVIGGSPLDELDVKVYNGRFAALYNTDEADLAKNVNDIVFWYKWITAIPGLSKFLKWSLGEDEGCAASLNIPLAEGFAELENSPDFATALGILPQLYGPIVDCMNINVDAGNITPIRRRLISVSHSALSNYGTLSNTGFLFQFLWDTYNAPADLIYTYTKVGSNWRGKLLVESNEGSTFEGIPGSITSIPNNLLFTDNPSFSLKERPFMVRRVSGTSVYESDPIDYTADPFADGFTFFGLMSGTQAVYIDDIPYSGFQLYNRPVSAEANELEWTMKINTSTPATATLNVGLMHQGVHLNTIEGTTSGWMNFTSTIKAPELLEAQGNGQAAEAETWLPVNPMVILKAQDGASIHDYTVYFEVVEGGGSIGVAGQAQTTVATNGLGLAGIAWKLGPGGNQRLRAYVDPSGDQVLAEFEFEASILQVDCEGVPGGPAMPGTPCDDANPNTMNDAFDGSCECIGQPPPPPLDCEGVPGGSALPGSPCDDGDPDTPSSSYNINCVCTGDDSDCLPAEVVVNLILESISYSGYLLPDVCWSSSDTIDNPANIAEIYWNGTSQSYEDLIGIYGEDALQNGYVAVDYRQYVPIGFGMCVDSVGPWHEENALPIEFICCPTSPPADSGIRAVQNPCPLELPCSNHIHDYPAQVRLRWVCELDGSSTDIIYWDP